MPAAKPDAAPAKPAVPAKPAAKLDAAPVKPSAKPGAAEGAPAVRPLVSDLVGERAKGAGAGRGGGLGASGGGGGGGAPLTGSAARTGAVAPAGKAEEEFGPDGTRAMPVPLPPEAAPLKLLAELTNTPPPRQTLVRTIARRFKIWTPLVVLLAIVFVIVQAVRPLPSPSLKLTAASSFTFGGTPLPQSMPWPAEGQSVAEVEGLGSLGVHGAQTPVPIASVTKVMTAYVILRDHPLTGDETGPTLTVDAQAAAEAGNSDQSTAHVQQGQKYTERQMLTLLLVPSGNNIARLLARWDAGTQEAFVAKMRQAAASLGMTSTTYTGASGIESTTKSTAVDQLKLARVVMQNSVFRSVVAQPNVTLPGVGRIFNNNNDLTNPGVIGIKTGSSTPAGGALMWAARKRVAGKQQLIIGVVLQQRGGGGVPDAMLQVALHRAQDLINSVQGGLTSATIVKKGEVVGLVDDGLGGKTPVVAGKDLSAVGWPGMRTGLTLTVGNGGLPHNAKAGTQVGTLSFGTGSARTTVPVVLQTDLKEPSFGKKLIRLG